MKKKLLIGSRIASAVVLTLSLVFLGVGVGLHITRTDANFLPQFTQISAGGGHTLALTATVNYGRGEETTLVHWVWVIQIIVIFQHVLERQPIGLV